MRNLAAISLLLIATPALSEPLPRAESQLTIESEEPILPAGYKEVRWGQNPIGLQALRGVMEPQADYDPHLGYLLETVAPGTDSDRLVRYTLWDEQLLEVDIMYQSRFTPTDGRTLVERFEHRYGDAFHDVVREQRSTGTEGRVAEEHWRWQDEFTVQILRRKVDGEQWSLVRYSRLLQARQEAQQRKEADAKKKLRVKAIELD